MLTIADSVSFFRTRNSIRKVSVNDATSIYIYVLIASCTVSGLNTECHTHMLNTASCMKVAVKCATIAESRVNVDDICNVARRLFISGVDRALLAIAIR